MHTLEQLIDIYSENYEELVVTAFTIVKTREMAEDIVQDLVEKILLDHEQFAKADTVIAYYKTSIYNAAKTRKKRERRIKATAPEFMEYQKNKYSSEHPQDIELAMDLKSILSKCTPQELRILELRYVYGYQLSEVAEILGTNVNALAQHMYRIRKKIEKTAGKEGLLLLVLLLLTYSHANRMLG